MLYGGVLYSLAIQYAYEFGTRALETAREMEELGVVVWAMADEEVRMLYHACRGESEEVQRCRQRVEDHTGAIAAFERIIDRCGTLAPAPGTAADSTVVGGVILEIEPEGGFAADMDLLLQIAYALRDGVTSDTRSVTE